MSNDPGTTNKHRAMIYGAYGYTGTLVVREASASGLTPILAGRSADKLAVVGGGHGPGMEQRPVALSDPAALDAALRDVAVVLHCAGPFSDTSAPMVDACLRTGTHYLDITGEMSVFEALRARDKEALAAGVMLLPGVGFDVVPTDAVAGWLKERLPSATHLELAFASVGGTASQGTAKTAVQNLHRGGAIRADGKIVSVPPAHALRTIDYGDGVERVSVAIPWGDLSTAWASTRIPNIVVYMAAPPKVVRAMKLMRFVRPLLATGAVQSFLRSRIEKGPPGPTDAQRAAGVSLIWGEARDAQGAVVVVRLHTAEGYTLTARSGVLACRKVLAGGAKPGYQTPTTAFGAGYVLEMEGSRRLEA